MARIFVTWPMEAAARAVLERAGRVETSPTEDELPDDELARRLADAEAVVPMGAQPRGLARRLTRADPYAGFKV